MKQDNWERIVSAQKMGIYESNYLKANSPDGQRGLWIKHNLLRPPGGPDIGEFWFIAFVRGEPPRVAKREVAWTALTLDAEAIGIRTQGISLDSEHAAGTLADMRWDLRLSPTMAPLFHLPWAWMYRAGFPKKKAITPAPNLRFNGEVHIGDERWSIEDWVGLRGHNWGTEHAWSYAYGNCNLWDDHAPRTVDGFSAKIRLPGGLRSPWLSAVIARGPDRDLTRLGSWFGGAQVLTDGWRLDKGPCQLQMHADPQTYVGLRYAHPNGAESYCYNTKFADVLWRVDGDEFTSRCGELEVLFSTPIDDIALHPTPDWDAAGGDYRG